MGWIYKEDKIELYFHGAMEGTKYDLIKKDNRARFEMDCEYKLVMPHTKVFKLVVEQVTGKVRMKKNDKQ